VVGDGAIPVLYAVAMGVDAVAALALGRLFDRIGMRALVVAAAVAAFFAPLVFFGAPALAFAGMVLWGVGMGAQESVMRAAVATMVPADRRATAYGTFNTGFGVCWFLGSALIGVLYDHSRVALVAFSVVAQLAALPLLVRVSRTVRGRFGQ
jgi:MFS family permease